MNPVVMSQRLTSPPAVHATDRQHAGRPWVGGLFGLRGAGMFGDFWGSAGSHDGIYPLVD